MIRTATIEDIDRLLELGRMFHAESPEYRDVSFDDTKVRRVLTSMIENPTGVIFVAMQDDCIVGGIVGMLTEYWFSNEKFATDLAVFVDPETRNGIIASKLVIALRIWATKMGARELKMPITAGINTDGVARLYDALGMRSVGQTFVKELNPCA
jgi:N-acetylglutamate synthase-like GNAT family acetyltransferase